MVAFRNSIGGDGKKYSDVLERFHYDPYGRPYFLDKESNLRQDGQSAYDWNILYGGYEYEPQTGLYHVRHRIYHPTLGLWLQPDPQGYADGVNLYQYVRGNPASLTDPSGEEVFTLGGLAIIGLMSVLGGTGVSLAHYGANEMTAGVDAGDAERYRRGQWFFGAGVGLTGAAITMPLAAVGGMAAGGLGLTEGSLAYGVTAGVVGGAVEGAVGGALAGGLTAYGFGADAGGIAEGAAWGAGIGGLTGAAFGAGFGLAGWGLRRAFATRAGARFHGEPFLFGRHARSARVQAIFEEAARASGIQDIRALANDLVYDAAGSYFTVIDGRRILALGRGAFRRTRAGQLMEAAHEIVHAQQFQRLMIRRPFASLDDAADAFFAVADKVYARQERVAEHLARLRVRAYLGEVTPQQWAASSRYIDSWR